MMRNSRLRSKGRSERLQGDGIKGARRGAAGPGVGNLSECAADRSRGPSGASRPASPPRRRLQAGEKTPATHGAADRSSVISGPLSSDEDPARGPRWHWQGRGRGPFERARCGGRKVEMLAGACGLCRFDGFPDKSFGSFVLGEPIEGRGDDRGESDDGLDESTVSRAVLTSQASDISTLDT